jgi:DNA-binding transcriptional ArsR family regulator
MEVLAAPRRREILRLVWRDELPAGEIHRALGDVTFGAVSQHLRLLESHGLVTRRGDAQRRLYAANRKALAPFRAWLEAMWGDALYRLKLKAELEQARRGPRAKKKRRRT